MKPWCAGSRSPGVADPLRYWLWGFAFSDAFEDGRHAHPAADAQRDESRIEPAPLEFVEGGAE
jgi:hypothetical protein